MKEIRQYKQNHSPSAALWFQHLSPDILKRSFVLALGIASLLTLVNQNAAVLGQQNFRVLALVLAFLTPFIVILLSQLGATHQVMNDQRHKKQNTATQSLVQTMGKHNIPKRALIIALCAGSITTVVFLSERLWLAGELNQLPLPQIAQSYALPFIFGLFSQAMAYRRGVN